MNATVASLTSRSLLGRKRTMVLLLLPLALLGLSVLARVLAHVIEDQLCQRAPLEVARAELDAARQRCADAEAAAQQLQAMLTRFRTE